MATKIWQVEKWKWQGHFKIKYNNGSEIPANGPF